MVDDHGLGAPLSLSAFARIVHNERINHRGGSEDRLRKARVGQSDGFSGQPFKIAVLAQLDDCMGIEFEPKPEIECDVVVRRHEIGAVISFFGIKVVAPRRLDSDNEVAMTGERQRESAVRAKRIAVRIAPLLFDSFPDLLRQRAVMKQIVVQLELNPSPSGGAVGQPVRRACQQFAHDFAAGPRRVANVISEFVKRIEDPRRRCRSVQPDAVRDPAVLVGIVR